MTRININNIYVTTNNHRAHCQQLTRKPLIHNTSYRQLTLHFASLTCVKTKQIVVTTNNVILAAKRGCHVFNIKPILSTFT